jgi:hypothetical protein
MKKALVACALILMIGTGINHAYAENASNPLASVNNTDLPGTAVVVERL